jgi:phosphoglycolate phosphatase-like HAD superfamily hydrolase
MLLTGNTERGARAKLTHYELADFFEGGAFSTDAGPRSQIAERALHLVRTRFPEAAIEPGHVFVIGDTPHDIECARAVGARAIAVASGVYRPDALRLQGAWRVLDRIPPPEDFVALIETA